MVSSAEEDTELRSPWASDIEVWPDDPVEADRLRRSAEAHRTELRKQAEATTALHRGPPVAYTISQELYKKAAEHNDQLTDTERQLLLSRGDTIGKALARPESLTPEEHNEALARPPPNVVSQNIRRATGGALSTPAEMYAKVRRLWESGDLDSLSQAEIALLGRDFWAWDSTEPEALDRIYKLKVPGYEQAAELLHAQEGLHVDSLSEAMLHMSVIKDLASQPLTAELLQLSVGAFADVLVDLQKQWSDGDIDNATYKLRSTRCINELRRLSQKPLVESSSSAVLPPPSFLGPPSESGLPYAPGPTAFTTPSTVGNISTPSIQRILQIPFPQSFPSSEIAPNTVIPQGTPLSGTSIPPASGLPCSTRLPFQPGVLSAPGSISPHPTTASGPGGFGFGFRPAPQPGNMPPAPGAAPLNSSMKYAGGSPMWAPTMPLKTELGLYMDDLRAQGKAEGLDNKGFMDIALKGWKSLGAEERKRYGEKLEAVRLALWDELHKREEAQRAAFAEAKGKRKAEEEDAAGRDESGGAR